jgi:hypothetical protein
MRSLHTLARPAAIAALLAGGACIPERPPGPIPSPVPSTFWDGSRADTVAVVPTRGEVPIADGDALTREFGPQGGAPMVVVQVECAGVDASTALFGVRFLDASGSEVARGGSPGYEDTDGVVRATVQSIFASAGAGAYTLEVRVRDQSGAQGTSDVSVAVR